MPWEQGLPAEPVAVCADKQTHRPSVDHATAFLRGPRTSNRSEIPRAGGEPTDWKRHVASE